MKSGKNRGKQEGGTEEREGGTGGKEQKRGREE